MTMHELQTPALLVDAGILDANLRDRSRRRCRARGCGPHVKAHKCTALARRQAALGHRGFTCATIREVEGLAAAGLGDDLLLANEVLDARAARRARDARASPSRSTRRRRSTPRRAAACARC